MHSHRVLIVGVVLDHDVCFLALQVPCRALQHLARDDGHVERQLVRQVAPVDGHELWDSVREDVLGAPLEHAGYFTPEDSLMPRLLHDHHYCGVLRFEVI